jgi:hypothetical protein
MDEDAALLKATEYYRRSLVGKNKGKRDKGGRGRSVRRAVGESEDSDSGEDYYKRFVDEEEDEEEEDDDPRGRKRKHFKEEKQSREKKIKKQKVKSKDYIVKRLKLGRLFWESSMQPFVKIQMTLFITKNPKMLEFKIDKKGENRRLKLASPLWKLGNDFDVLKPEEDKLVVKFSILKTDLVVEEVTATSPLDYEVPMWKMVELETLTEYKQANDKTEKQDEDKKDEKNKKKKTKKR